MATINGRKVRIWDDAGQERIGIASGWREGSQWVKVTITDGLDELKARMIHESEPLEVVRDEREGE